MDINETVKALAALSQESRLQAFRLLVRCGYEGMAAGKIATTLEIPHNTLSSHLSIMQNAGLLQSRRQSRSIIYSIDFEGTRELLSFLMEDCCQGHPELCLPRLEDKASNCCVTSNNTGEKNETPTR